MHGKITGEKCDCVFEDNAEEHNYVDAHNIYDIVDDNVDEVKWV